MKDEKARILELMPGNFGTGGSSVIVWRWYCNMDSADVRIDFFCSDQPESQFLQIIDSNDSICYVQKCRGNKVIRKIALIRQLASVLTFNHYDCIHIHCDTTYAAAPIILFLSQYVNKIIVHSHSTSLGGGWIKTYIHRFCKVFMYDSRVVPLACSEDAAKWFYPRRILNKKGCTIIKNGIDVERYMFDQTKREAIRRELGVQNQFVIGHVGRFAYPKNHDFLVDIFYQVHKKCPNSILLLIGGDKGEGILGMIKEKVEHLEMSKNVIFYGNSDRLDEIYQAMDCFVFPSWYEGLGIVAVEAQAAGLKTICSDGVPQEARITSLFEYMSLKDSPEKWADKILSYNDGYKRKDMSKEIRIAGYDIRESAKQLESIYMNCRDKIETIHATFKFNPASKFNRGGG